MSAYGKASPSAPRRATISDSIFNPCRGGSRTAPTASPMPAGRPRSHISCLSCLNGRGNQGDEPIAFALKQPAQVPAAAAASGQPPQIAGKPGKFWAGRAVKTAAGGAVEEPDGEDQAHGITKGMFVAAGDGDCRVQAGNDRAAMDATAEFFFAGLAVLTIFPDKLFRRRSEKIRVATRQRSRPVMVIPAGSFRPAW